jgi:hypothetical protein
MSIQGIEIKGSVVGASFTTTMRAGEDGVSAIAFDGDGVRVLWDDGQWAWYPNGQLVCVWGLNGRPGQDETGPA